MDIHEQTVMNRRLLLLSKTLFLELQGLISTVLPVEYGNRYEHIFKDIEELEQRLYPGEKEGEK